MSLAELQAGHGASAPAPVVFPCSNLVTMAHGARSLAPALRDYQVRVIEAVERAIDAGKRRPLIPLPTGGGKTVIAAEIIRRAVDEGRRVLFLAHRKELILQASQKLDAVGVDHGIIQAGLPTSEAAPVQVASIQTLHARAVRGSSMEMPAADVVIVDEAHHARAETYRKILDAFPGAAVIGLSATPCRSDGRGLGNVFDTLIDVPSVADLTRDGFLVPGIAYAPVVPDLKGVRVERGDYVERQLAEAMNKPKLVGDVVAHWHRLGQGRPTICFATGVAHSVALRDAFRAGDVLAEHIDGSTPPAERDAILAGLRAGTVRVVTNAMVLTEGFDAPDVGCLILARPTKSIGLFRQMIGRALRSAPGKSDAVILDHAGAVLEHGLPDDPIEWELAEDKRASSPAQAARKQGKSPGLTTCPECSAIRMSGKPCAACGWTPRPRARAVEVADGELGRVGRDGRAAGRAVSYAERVQFYLMLRWIAETRGRKPGWAAYSYRDRFGDWPPAEARYRTPMEPTPEVHAWVKSRAIAFARSRDAAGRAAA